MYWRKLGELDLADRAEYGGKAAHLGHAAQLGCPVLPGVALSTRLFQRFVEQGGLLGEVSSILGTMQPRTMPQFQAAAWAIRSAFRVRRMPQDVHDALLSAWREMGVRAMSIRSSATNEDSPMRSFVGQHASTLNIGTEEQVLAAALESWTSLFSAKALAYAQRFGVDLLSSSMGLIMQPMITAEIRGALATLDPITGDPDRFILEIHQGPARGVFDLDPYARKPGELSYWSQLRYYGLLLDEHDLAYQAIEWAIHEGNLSFLRVRPATAVAPFLPPKEMPKELGARMALASPAVASLRALPPYSRYHLSRMGLGDSSPALPEDEARGDPASQMQVCGYLYRAIAPDEARRTLDTGVLGLMAQSLRRVTTSTAVSEEAAALLEAQKGLLDTGRQTPLDSLAGPELADLLRQMQSTGDALIARCLQVDAAIDGLCVVLERIYREWAQLDVAASSPLSRWRARADRPRGQGAELPMQSAATLELTDILAEPLTHSAQPQGVETAIAEPAGAFAALISVEPSVLARLNRLQRPIYGALVERGRQLQRLAAKLDAAARLCRQIEREAVSEAGQRLHAASLASEARDVALLEADELDHWMRGATRDEYMMRWIMHRRAERRRAWRYCPPRMLDASGPDADADLAACDLVLKGLAVCAGVVAGRARVIRTLAETTTVLPGEVLVCQEAKYELSLLFGTVVAIVAEKGALLDHSSMLIREYDLPAVFAVAGASEQIGPGDQLIVDAMRGLVGIRKAGPRYPRFALGEL